MKVCVNPKDEPCDTVTAVVIITGGPDKVPNVSVNVTVKSTSIGYVVVNE